MWLLIAVAILVLLLCHIFTKLTSNPGLQDELSEKSLLAAKKDELDAAAKQWKNRVEKTDAEKFSVAGKMSEKIKDAVPSINIPAADKAKRTPHAKRYKGREGKNPNLEPQK